MNKSDIRFRPATHKEATASLKSEYLRSLTSPMDGMWESGLIPAEPHYRIELNSQLVGFFVLNEDQYLLQFYLGSDARRLGAQVFNQIVEQYQVVGALVHSIDPYFLSLCLDIQKKVTVHTRLYEYPAGSQVELMDEKSGPLRKARASELPQIVPFQVGCLGGNASLTEWLTGYSTDLLNKEEIFILENDGDWIGLGECRSSASQSGVVDVGMMVDPGFRGLGWGTHILQLLTTQAIREHKTPICSTTKDNIGSQIAIERAGYQSSHRILDISFID